LVSFYTDSIIFYLGLSVSTAAAVDDNTLCLLDWINFMLEPGVSGLLTQRQGLANTLTVSLGNF